MATYSRVLLSGSTNGRLIKVAATSTPLEALLKLTDTAIQMGMSEVIVKEIRTALKRGFAAEVDRVVEIATDELTAPDHGPYFP